MYLIISLGMKWIEYRRSRTGIKGLIDFLIDFLQVGYSVYIVYITLYPTWTFFPIHYPGLSSGKYRQVYSPGLS